MFAYAMYWAQEVLNVLLYNIIIVRNRRPGIAPSLRSSADCRAHPKYELRSYAPSARHPCLNSGLFEHRVQTLLKSSRISSTSKFQTYRICSRSHRKTNHPHIQMISELPGSSYCYLLFYCPYYTKVITIKIPKYLADCLLPLPNWGVSFYFGNLLQLTCFLLLPYWGIFLIFKFLLQMTCFLLLFHWGFFLYFENLLQPACFLLQFIY